MLDAELRKLLEPRLAPVGKVAAAHVTANQLTIAGFAAGIAAAGLIAANLSPVALVFLVFARAADGLDGAVARVHGPTALGAFLDTALDLIVYAALPLAFAIRSPDSALAAAFLLFGFTSMMTLELALRFWSRRAAMPSSSEAIGQVIPAAPPLAPSLLGHSETFIVFGVACAYPPAFPVLCYVYGALCFIVAGMRVAAAVAHLRGGGDS